MIREAMTGVPFLTDCSTVSKTAMNSYAALANSPTDLFVCFWITTSPLFNSANETFQLLHPNNLELFKNTIQTLDSVYKIDAELSSLINVNR